mgnify:CR=1 FL=1
MEETNLENFDNFINEVKEKPEENEDIEVNINQPITNINTKEDFLCCPYDNYIPRKHCKDKRKAIINHIKKKHPEKLNEYLNNYPEYKTKPKKEKVEKISTVIQEIDDSSRIVLNEDEQKLKLVADLDVLNAKFATLWKCPNYSYPESSVEHLERLKATYTKLINDKLTNKLCFNTIVGVAKMGERVSESLNICDLEGYAFNIQNNEEELLGIIDELISSQTLDMSQITPDIKLCICLLNIGIKTAEQNKVKSNLNEVS